MIVGIFSPILTFFLYMVNLPANRGRGTIPTARGGSITAGSFNSRAQGLYDPRDPKGDEVIKLFECVLFFLSALSSVQNSVLDRPRNRLRSTSDEGDTTNSSAPVEGWTAVKSQSSWSSSREPSTGAPWSKDAGRFPFLCSQ